MLPDEFSRFHAVMTGMAELYQRELSPVLLDAYWISLRDWPLEAFEAAAGQLMKTAEFMPRPADFTALRKAGRATAGEAWAKVLEFARKGYIRWDGGGRPTRDNSVESPDEQLIDRAVRAIGGYEAIAMSPTDKTHFLEKRFCEHYSDIQDAEEIREAVPQIAFDEPARITGPRRLLG